VFLNTGAGLKYPDTVPVDDLEVLPVGAPLDRPARLRGAERTVSTR